MEQAVSELQHILNTSTPAEICNGLQVIYEKRMALKPNAVPRVLRQEINLVEQPITGALLRSENVSFQYGTAMAAYIRKHWPRSIAASADETLAACELIRFFTDNKVLIYIALLPKTKLPEVRIPINGGKQYLFWRLDHHIPATLH